MVKTKLKPILPSLREKKRYLVFEVISKERIKDINPVSDTIKSSILAFNGTVGAAKTGFLMLKNKWDAQNQRGVLKVSHKHVDSIKSSLLFIDKIDKKQAIVKSLGTSGILKKAEGKYLKLAS
jgi:ribonuclease P/MRP protein subunit POP5